MIFLGFFIGRGNLAVILHVIPAAHLVFEPVPVGGNDVGVDLVHDLVVLPAPDFPGDRPGHLQMGGQAGTASASSFTVVTLSNGQVLTGGIGCEVMLRVGSATCVSPSNPGLIDQSNASVLNNGGALVQNHLYMMTIEGRGVKATAATTKLMVRGSYTIG